MVAPRRPGGDRAGLREAGAPGFGEEGHPRLRDPGKRWKPDPRVPSLVWPGVDARDKGVREARPRG